VFRILLVQQMNLFRAALAAVLSNEDDLDVVAQLARIKETIPIAQAVKPDVAVIDLDLLANGDLVIAGHLNEALPSCALIVLAGPDMTQTTHEALNKHVRGFVGKDTPPSQLIEWIRQVATGERVIDPTLAVAALSAPRNPLTAREQEVLRVAALGVPSPEIAARLHLSVGTVRNYLSAIMHKTGARNRLEAVRIAEEAGWM
jgi:two-component system response regulator DesR